jgi:predicted membrane GTPase involved in stress response
MDSYGYFHLPIEQLVRPTDTRLRLRFVAEASELFPEDEEYVVAPSSAGLLILGRNEQALEMPVDILREVYGFGIAVHPPRARLIPGSRTREPVMHVRISLERRFAERVKDAMAIRGATPTEEYASANYCILRYEAPLACLLGLPAELSQLTGGKARHWTALSHYAHSRGATHAR